VSIKVFGEYTAQSRKKKLYSSAGSLQHIY